MLRQKPFAVNLAKMLKKQPLGLLKYYVCIKGWGGEGGGEVSEKANKSRQGEGEVATSEHLHFKRF